MLNNLLKGKNIIITGGHNGIGFEVAYELAKRNASVILACHDLIQATTARRLIISNSRNKKIYVEFLDLANLQSIRDFCEKIKANFSSLDVLINNATIKNVESYTTTPEGFELHFVVNYLGHFCLTNLLLDMLKESVPSKIINITSEDYKKGQMNWEDLQSEVNYSGVKCYRQSQIARLLFTFELRRKLQGSGVDAIAVNSAIVMRDIFYHQRRSALVRFMLRIAKPILCLCGEVPTDVAQTIVYYVISDTIPGQSGYYYIDADIIEDNLEGIDVESAVRLWNISSELVGLEDEEQWII